MKWTLQKEALLFTGVLPLLAFLGCTPAFQRNVPPLHQQAQSIANSVPDVIIIDVLPNTRGKNNFTYIPSEVQVPPGTAVTVAWVSWHGPFKLTYNPNLSGGLPWPFMGAQGDIASSPNKNGQFTAARTVDASAAEGYYHFTVELDLGGGVKITDPYCPPIIINRIGH